MKRKIQKYRLIQLKHRGGGVLDEKDCSGILVENRSLYRGLAVITTNCDNTGNVGIDLAAYNNQ